jgi:hypothetical protein
MKRAKCLKKKRLFAYRRSPNYAYLKQFYDAAAAQGAKAISSDFTFEIEGFEQSFLIGGRK